ncbi:uncharacterized protein EV154DRAFT_481078 [Mucor mucedo]|uniref:uncharacterized protein n=1 Tax=Mucor mucedo TaxID=29922 RepID=UPI0022208E8A|nr:uncharacterized protein EV154DRAFT_481078 [Mucor mucedo]KAI7891647.1 hypothetical protein EV154DRAFT_481078 [Mucor mucedo]
MFRKLSFMKELQEESLNVLPFNSRTRFYINMVKLFDMICSNLKQTAYQHFIVCCSKATNTQLALFILRFIIATYVSFTCVYGPYAFGHTKKKLHSFKESSLFIIGWPNFIKLAVYHMIGGVCHLGYFVFLFPLAYRVILSEIHYA